MITNIALNKKPVTVMRALLSVFDKTGIVDLAKVLHSLDIEILSTGGTAKTLKNAGIPVIDVTSFTGFPEIMDGRVKTINPLIAGGVLGLRDAHKQDAQDNNIKWIDLVVCNLYPFSKVTADDDCDLPLAMENIDIGGPTMIRSAAKNLGWTSVLVDPADYADFSSEMLENKAISFETRKQLSVKAFGHTAQYDAVIHQYLTKDTRPEVLNITYEKHSDLRYGENPHQAAAAYKIPENKENNILNAIVHQGKKLSYNNIMDADGALACLKEFSQPACVVVKHANPCGVAVGGNDLTDIYLRAFNADSLSAFGGVVALNGHCTQEVAREISKVFVEIVLAPSFEPSALEVFSKKKNLRVLETGELKNRIKKLELRNIDGGILAQETDTMSISLDDLKTVSKIIPSESDLKAMLFGWKVLKYVKSNGILIVNENSTIGVGAGQVSRVDAVDIALKKAGNNSKNAILCSDAFFPFRDSIDKIASTGIRAVIQPGGSIRDNEVIEACDEHKIAMVFTGSRCFKH